MMSDPHQAASSVSYSFFESLLGDDGCQQYGSSTLEYMSGCALPGKTTRWPDWSACDFDALATEVSAGNAVTSPSDDSEGFKTESWMGDHDDRQPQQARKKRKVVAGSSAEVVPMQGASRERQRGKNWEKTEEDILVESKRKEMDWKSISEVLKEHGFVRNHKHCADKWYALRKHYLEIHQWMADHPGVQYWDRSDGERIRSVPPSFCQKWYHIFDAAEKREGRKKVTSLNQRRIKSDQAAHPLAMSNCFAPSIRPECGPSFRSQPSCSLSDHGLQQQHQPISNSGDAAYEVKHEDEAGFLMPAAGAYNSNVDGPSSLPKLNIQMLVTEIHTLSNALLAKFEAEQKERERNFDIKQRKLELKRQRFDYKRQRDEEKRRTVAQCLNVAVKAYD